MANGDIEIKWTASRRRLPRKETNRGARCAKLPRSLAEVLNIPPRSSMGISSTVTDEDILTRRRSDSPRPPAHVGRGRAPRDRGVR
ncbi:hypothetical protein EVAR_55013_1 [Eumeta japonica]|uniref:Uncharacterized protein n=1 Tax=Eumeta variegata TaxID=151549 RepID=A0A4C1YFM8_EUMVA|nr:hypothetical protein EVAR_55013_1 [Eumeta japonica]